MRRQSGKYESFAIVLLLGTRFGRTAFDALFYAFRNETLAMATSVVGAFTTLQFVFMLSGTVVSIGTRRAARANQKNFGAGNILAVFTDDVGIGRLGAIHVTMGKSVC